MVRIDSSFLALFNVGLNESRAATWVNRVLRATFHSIWHNDLFVVCLKEIRSNENDARDAHYDDNNFYDTANLSSPNANYNSLHENMTNSNLPSDGASKSLSTLVESLF